MAANSARGSSETWSIWSARQGYKPFRGFARNGVMLSDHIAHCRNMVHSLNSDHFVGVNEMVEGSPGVSPHRIRVHRCSSVVNSARMAASSARGSSATRFYGLSLFACDFAGGVNLLRLQ